MDSQWETSVWPFSMAGLGNDSFFLRLNLHISKTNQENYKKMKIASKQNKE